MKFKRLTALLIAGAMIVGTCTACDNAGEEFGSSGSESVVISLPSEETDPADATDPSQPEVMDAYMFAVRKGVIKDDASVNGECIATFDVGESFHVVGVMGNCYIVELSNGSLGYIIAYKLSIDAPYQNEDGEEETEETDETSESSQDEESESDSPAPAPAAEEADEPAPAGGPDMSVTYNGNSIGSYEVDGYGTVYGYFVDTSEFRDLVNSHRSEIGISEWSFSDSDAARTRAIECTVTFDHTRPNGQSGLSVLGGYGGEIIYSATDGSGAYNGFLGSDGHREIMESTDFPNASSAAFIRVEWVDGSWNRVSSSLVCNCW